MPKAKSVDFGEEVRILEGGDETVKEARIEPVEVLGNEIPPLEFDTVVRHLRRHGYNVNPSPKGGSQDVEAHTGDRSFDISVLKDDAAQVEFKIDTEDADDEKPYVETPYTQIIDELVEREKKLERASENYVSAAFESEDPVERIESDFRLHGENVEEVVESYFSDMRPSELAMNYAVHFELHPGETVENERRNLPGKIPLADALTDEDKKDRNKLYFERYLGKVLEKVNERAELSDELEEYGWDLVEKGRSLENYTSPT